VVKETKDSIKFTVAKGKAKAAAESLRGQFRDAGWKEKVASITGMSGTLLFLQRRAKPQPHLQRHRLPAHRAQPLRLSRRTGTTLAAPMVILFF
jgi:hypothetical protein